LNREFLERARPVKSINWLIPPFEHAYGGVVTILRFAARLQEAHGVDSRIVIYDYPGADIVNPAYPNLDLERMRSAIARHFPVLAPKVMLTRRAGTEELPAADAAVATYWTSAYIVSKMENVRAKFYFIQDYEPSFNEGGTKYGLIDTTYRLGLLRLVNTPGLLDWIKLLHGGEGTAFVPSVDRKIYHPRAEGEGACGRAVRVFFYARPGASRNGFMLGAEALKRIKAAYGERVEIVTAGMDWEPLHYGLEGVLTNRGLLKSSEEVAELYRSCDIGLVFMYSRHPSYQPFEFMATGCAVVTNHNSATRWLLKDGENALLVEPMAASVAEAIGTLIDDADLRRRLVARGYASVPSSTWDEVIDDACRRAGLLR
jgi:glycosyltransferase involved in cell wall biosynthesis